MPGGKELPRQKTVDKSLGLQDNLPSVRGGLGAVQTPSACVIRSYSTVSEHEDRATLLEYILRPEAPARAEENFAENPILKAKLDYLAELSRSAVAYVYWDEILKGR